MSSVVLFNKISTSDIRFGGVEKTKRGSKMVLYEYQGVNKRLLFQTPKCRAPYGISTWMGNEGDAPVNSIDLSLEDGAFRTLLEGLDSMLISGAMENNWFSKPVSGELMSELRRPLVKAPSDPKYSPTCKVKITATTSIFDENRTPMELNDIKKGSTVRLIVELSPVWFLASAYGVSLRAVQVQVVAPPSGGGQEISSFAFIGEPDDDEDEGGEDGNEL